MKIQEVYNVFVENLFLRKELNTEDNVRFYWFVSMYSLDPELDHYTLEYPYGDILKGKELDMYYRGKDEDWCLEIKFHRRSHVTKSSKPRTAAAGSLIDDLHRLECFSNSSVRKTRRLFLYVTDDEMDRFLSAGSPVYRDELSKLYRLEEGMVTSLQFEKNGTSSTFFTAANRSFVNHSDELTIPAISLLKKTDSDRYHVRLYEVCDPDDGYKRQQLDKLQHYRHLPCVTISMKVAFDWTSELPKLVPNIYYVDMRKQNNVQQLMQKINEHASFLLCFDHVSEVKKSAQQYELSQLIYTALSNEEYEYKDKFVDFSKLSTLFIQHIAAERPYDDFYEYGSKKRTILINTNNSYGN